MKDERRRHSRIRLAMPLRVRGWNSDQTSWEEITETEDVSSDGVAFFSRHPVELGQVLHLSLPLPKRFRQYDAADAAYLIYAVVRYVGGPRVGAMFVGKTPPKGFQENPALRTLPADPQTARRFPRHSVMVNVRLKRFVAPPGEAADEVTVTEDVSQGGALVLTAMPIVPAETVMFEELGGDFRCRSSVRTVSVGADKLPRLGLMFLEDDAASRSVAWLKRIGVPVEPAGPVAARPSPPPPSPAPSPTPVLRSLQVTRTVFDECLESEHAICPTGRAARAEGKFHLCSCSCHGT